MVKSRIEDYRKLKDEAQNCKHQQNESSSPLVGKFPWFSYIFSMELFPFLNEGCYATTRSFKETKTIFLLSAHLVGLLGFKLVSSLTFLNFGHCNVDYLIAALHEEMNEFVASILQYRPES